MTVSDGEDLLIVGLVIAAIFFLKDAITSAEDALGITPPPASAPPAPPCYQDVQFDAGCQKGYIKDSDGNCVQVTCAIHE